MTIKNNKNALFEPFLLFCLFYLPSYLQQTTSQPWTFFSRIDLQFIYMCTVIPQIMLILYLMQDSGLNFLIIPPDQDWKSYYGIKKISSPFPLLILGLGIFAITYGGSVVIGFVNKMQTSSVPWQKPATGALFFAFFTCIFTGIAEELFFRSFVYKRMQAAGIKAIHHIPLVSILFALGHFYEGLPAFLLIFVQGMLLAVYFRQRNNIIENALAHGLYNFSILFIIYITN